MQEELSGGGELVSDDGNHKFIIARYFMGEPDNVFVFIGKTPMDNEKCSADPTTTPRLPRTDPTIKIKESYECLSNCIVKLLV